ncbi:MAG: hypothetical protein P8X73_01450 [Ignavibacteriaceae bacterium]
MNTNYLITGKVGIDVELINLYCLPVTLEETGILCQNIENAYPSAIIYFKVVITVYFRKLSTKYFELLKLISFTS